MIIPELIYLTINTQCLLLKLDVFWVTRLKTVGELINDLCKHKCLLFLWVFEFSGLPC